MPIPKAVCVFCGSSPGLHPIYKEVSAELGKQLADHGIRLVFGGGHIGLMGVVADSVIDHGGHVTGVIPESLQMRELAHPNVQDLRVVDSMHTRKAMMAELADAFVALPGGLGTFEELCEILTWAQLRFHTKPVVILNVNGYYDSLLQLIRHGINEGFMRAEHERLFRVVDGVADLIDYLIQQDPGTTDPKALYDKT